MASYSIAATSSVAATFYFQRAFAVAANIFLRATRFFFVFSTP
jgi:hypothetical protein